MGSTGGRYPGDTGHTMVRHDLLGLRGAKKQCRRAGTGFRTQRASNDLGFADGHDDHRHRGAARSVF